MLSSFDKALLRTTSKLDQGPRIDLKFTKVQHFMSFATFLYQEKLID